METYTGSRLAWPAGMGQDAGTWVLLAAPSLGLLEGAKVSPTELQQGSSMRTREGFYSLDWTM